ncbi:uncharacterized protein LOC128546281 [Mercenaria mercenaria]|uniref:uncharacterized protein LOC128546281 n=1 Tax=Mercenaria mercenaria TaxID=6596 RepID=UPI00234E9005|nr:uncharacterized protein LOC128546281 [Mercenaria mercenaria]
MDLFDTASELESRLNLLNSLYALLPEDTDSLDRLTKRRSLFRFGKRRSLFHFGKRGSILRFGKHPATYDFGEYDSEFNPSELYALNEDPRADSLPLSDKRSSLFRFGKKSRDTSSLYERDAAREKKPHTPWRFDKTTNGHYLG